MLSTEHIFLYALFAVFLAGVHALSKQSLFPAGCWMLVSGTLYAWFAGTSGLAPPLPHLDHDLILHGFLPLLIFSAVRRFRLSTLRAVAPDAIFLSTGGLLLAAVFFAAGMVVFFQMPPLHALLLGVALASTDPVAILALLGTRRISPKLKTLLESESMFNDGTAAVFFAVLLAFARDAPAMEGPHPLRMFLWMTLGGAGTGAVFGAMGAGLLHSLRGLEKSPMSILVPLSVIYFTFSLAELHLGVSGMIAVFSATLALTALSPCDADSPGAAAGGCPRFDELWEFLESVLSGVLFFGLGAMIGSHAWNLTWPAVAGMALLMLLSRALILFTTKAAFHFTRWTLPLHWLPILQLAGMKGAVSAALLMTQPLDDPLREFFLCAAYAMILFTFLTHPPLAAKVLRNL